MRIAVRSPIFALAFVLVWGLLSETSESVHADEQSNEATRAELADVETQIHQLELLKAQLQEEESSPRAQYEEQLLQPRARQQRELKDQQMAELAEVLDRLKDDLLVRQATVQSSEEGLPNDAKLVAFKVKYALADKTADLIERILEGQQYRLAVDTRANMIILRGSEALLEPVRTLLEHIDRPSSEEVQREQSQPALRNFQVRLYWLATASSGKELRDPAAALPPAVLDALERVGLAKPVLVSETTSTFAIAEGQRTQVSAYSLALMGSQPLQFRYRGSISYEAGQVHTNAELVVDGDHQCEISGSIAAPLGHYVLLGTADSLATKRPPRKVAPSSPYEPQQTEGDKTSDEAWDAQFAKPNLPSPARFAFVLQVVEAESFAPED